ncbi:juvenile hormone-binding protein-like [Hyposmocoma kahamanoa]|uniref:juvenile hormone-binding protein-like n=1 Tax=Hyposmocoma kahamanoa TaxID=1477025 RepID=UPI000E6D6195|nr:juvenile hormone-binding protein-like [Hyposmocoma kahamanoa]
MFTKVISLLFLVHCVRCAPAEDFQTRPCAVDDFQCINESFEAFMTKTASGIPALDVKANDPLMLDSVVSNVFEGVVVHFKNVTVTGLSKQKLTEYKMDTLAKSIVFTVTSDISTASDVEVEYEETKKKFTGTHTGSGILR